MMVPAGIRRGVGAGRAAGDAAWLVVAGFTSAIVARAAVTLSTWQWAFGGMVGVAVAALAVAPVLSASGLVAMKEVMPRSAAVIALHVVFGVVALIGGAWRQIPRVPAIAFGLLLLITLPTLPLDPAPWDRVPEYYLPGTDWQFFPITSYEVLDALSMASIASISLVVAFAIKRRADVEMFMLALMAGAAIPFLTGMKDLATGNLAYHDGSPSIESTLGHPNALAMFCVATVPSIIAFGFWTDRKLVRWAAFALGGIGAVCLVFTFTRSAWFATIIGVVIAGIVAGRLRHVVALAAAVVALAFVTGAGGEVTQRLTSFTITTQITGDTNDSWQWRLLTWTRMYQAYPADHGLTGFGFGTYPRRTVEAFGMYGGQINTNLVPGARRGFGAHNDYLTMLLQNGFPALLLWTTFLVSLSVIGGRIWRRAKDPLALAVVVSGVALTVMSFSDNVLGAEFSLGIVAAVLTASVILDRQRRAA